MCMCVCVGVCTSHQECGHITETFVGRAVMSIGRGRWEGEGERNANLNGIEGPGMGRTSLE